MTLRILSGGAAQGLVERTAPAFLAASKHDIAGTYGAIGAMKERLLAGEAADLVILSRAMVEQLERDGHVARGALVDIGVVETGIAVRAGRVASSISDGAALTAALRAADAIYFPDPARATAGVHFARVLDRLGIAAEVRDRCRTFPHGQAAMAAMAAQPGGNPIGCTQETEIRATPGVVYAGPFPDGFGLATIYTAGIVARASEPDAARQLAAVLAAPENASMRASLGFRPVE